MSHFESVGTSALAGDLIQRIGDGWMLISVANRETGIPNTMTASWGTVGVLWNKPVLTCFIRPQRFSYPLACREARMAFAFLPEQYRAALQYCGAHSGRDGDKFAAAGLTPAFTSDDDPVPYPAEASLVVVGRKLYEDDLREGNFLDPALFRNYPRKDFHRFFICEIEQVLAKREG